MHVFFKGDQRSLAAAGRLHALRTRRRLHFLDLHVGRKGSTATGAKQSKRRSIEICDVKHCESTHPSFAKIDQELSHEKASIYSGVFPKRNRYVIEIKKQLIRSEVA